MILIDYICFFQTCCVLISVVAIITYRIVIKYTLKNAPTTVASFVPSVTGATINLVIIVVLGRFYEWIAVKLTDMEHHKTDTQYETALSIKVYLFQFTNFYSSVFYIAFFKGHINTGKYFNEFVSNRCFN